MGLPPLELFSLRKEPPCCRAALSALSGISPQVGPADVVSGIESVHSLPHCSQRHVFAGSTPSRTGSSAPHAGHLGAAEFGHVHLTGLDNLARNGLRGNFARFSEPIGCDQYAEGTGREETGRGSHLRRIEEAILGVRTRVLDPALDGFLPSTSRRLAKPVSNRPHSHRGNLRMLSLDAAPSRVGVGGICICTSRTRSTVKTESGLGRSAKGRRTLTHCRRLAWSFRPRLLISLRNTCCAVSVRSAISRASSRSSSSLILR